MLVVGPWHKKRSAVHGFQTFQRCGHRNLWQLIINYYYYVITTAAAAAAKVELCAFMHVSKFCNLYDTLCLPQTGVKLGTFWTGKSSINNHTPTPTQNTPMHRFHSYIPPPSPHPICIFDVICAHEQQYRVSFYLWPQHSCFLASKACTPATSWNPRCSRQRQSNRTDLVRNININAQLIC
jgi:hypothetical protein